MLSKAELENWLQRINERFRADNIHPRERGFLALIELEKEFRITTFLGSQLSHKIFDWFKVNTQDGSQNIGPLFTGVYYYDACFWPVSISIGYGGTSINPFGALATIALRSLLLQQLFVLFQDETHVLKLVSCGRFNILYSVNKPCHLRAFP